MKSRRSQDDRSTAQFTPAVQPLLGLCLAIVLLVSLACGDSRAAPFANRGHGIQLSPAQQRELAEALESWHQRYDPAERMIRQPFSSPGYHTTLEGGWVHPTRDSLNYAVACLDTGDPQLLQRAVDILKRVIALQDQDPTHRTYGIWSWFLEEPLEKMSPPDWNWADFCGVALLQVALDHRHRLPPEVAAMVREALRHATRSIRKRNVGPGYTNIAIMGTYVTLIAAELYGWDDLKSYALSRLRRFYDYTRQHGAFTEYNSPTYTLVALKELARLRKDAPEPDARRMIEELYELAWEEIALHWHAPTRQWAGPHSRCYRTLLGKNVLALIQRSTEGRVDFGVHAPSLDAHRVPTPCPARFEGYFTEPRTAEVVRTFYRGPPSIVGTTYLTPRLALGSVNCGDLWNQRRPLVAYWGDAEHPSYLRVRFLRDGYDFAAVQFFSRQRRSRVLATLAVATDGGQRHVSLDRMKQATTRAKDLRLRFEIGGAAGRGDFTAPPRPAQPFTHDLGPVTLGLHVPLAAFGEAPPHWELTREKDTIGLDLVFYHGPERAFDFSKFEHAAVAFGLWLEAGRPTSVWPRASIQDGQLEAEWDGLRLVTPTRPARQRELRQRVAAQFRAQ